MNLVERFTQQYGRVPTEFDPDYLEMLRMSKYRIVDVPDIKPGKCSNCGSSKNDGRKYIDFGLEVDFYGIVFICGQCLLDIVKQMGLLKPLEEQVGILQDKVLNIKKQSARGGDLRKDFLKIFKEVQDYFTTLPVTSDDSSSSSNAGDRNAEATSVESGTANVKSAVNATEQRTVEPDSSSRPKQFSSLAELLDKQFS